MNPIQGINPATPALPPLTLEGGKPVDGPSFKNLMMEALDHVNNMQQNADAAVEKLVTGGDTNPAEVLTAIQKADMTFRMMLQVRNKLVQAYQEVREIRI